jgi:hypothetical protein
VAVFAQRRPGVAAGGPSDAPADAARAWWVAVVDSQDVVQRRLNGKRGAAV